MGTPCFTTTRSGSVSSQLPPPSAGGATNTLQPSITLAGGQAVLAFERNFVRKHRHGDARVPMHEDQAPAQIVHGLQHRTVTPSAQVPFDGANEAHRVPVCVRSIMACSPFVATLT